MEHNISINDDYAGIWLTDNKYLYYGYEYLWDAEANCPYVYSEETENNETEWCFVIKHDDKVIHQVPAHILTYNHQDWHEVDRMLLRGISWWIQTKKLL